MHLVFLVMVMTLMSSSSTLVGDDRNKTDEMVKVGRSILKRLDDLESAVKNIHGEVNSLQNRMDSADGKVW